MARFTTAATALAAASPTLPAAAHQATIQKSIPDRIEAVRKQIAREGQPTDGTVFYRLSQFLNFPNFPNFMNFPNFPNFANFPNFPNFPKF